MRFDPADTNRYRDSTKHHTVVFVRTKVCKACHKTRSIGQYRTPESSVCEKCRGVK